MTERLRVVGLVAVLAATLLVDGVGAEERSEAALHVQGTLEQVLGILGDESLSEDQRRERIEAIAFEQFDFPTMSRLVLARNWKRLSDAQQTDFVAEYKRLLSRSYGNRLDRFGDESVEVTGEQQEPRGDVTVRTRVVGGKYDGAQIDYRMRNRDGRWRAIDVVIEGVSLVSNYRAQFGDIVSKQGPDGLLTQMRQKNAAPADEAG